MTIKNNHYRRFGRLFHHARNHQNLSLFKASKETGIAISQLFALEEARMKFYEDHPQEAIAVAEAYAQYLEVDAHSLVHEIALANNIKISEKAIPAFLLKKPI